MGIARIRRLCVIFVGLAFILPLVPAAVGSPLTFGGHCGNAPRYGEPECLALSLGFLLLAAVGTGLTQRALPMRLRRWMPSKVLAIAISYVAILPVLTQTR